MAGNGVDTMWFLPSALNVKVKKFNYARVNGGSNYNSLKIYQLNLINFVVTLREIGVVKSLRRLVCKQILPYVKVLLFALRHNLVAGNSW